MFGCYAVAGFCPWAVVAEHEVEIDEIFAVIGNFWQLQSHGAALGGRAVGQRGCVLRHEFAIAIDGIFQAEIFEIKGYVAVVQSHALAVGSECEAHILIHFLHFEQFWCDATVGGDYTVGAEVGIVRHVAEAAAVVEIFLGFAVFVEALVYPVPYAAAYHALAVIFDVVPIFFEVAYGVTHGVSILAEHIWLLSAVLVHLHHRFDRGIHVRVDVGYFVLTFVVDGSRVEGAHCLIFGFDVASAARLVAERPYYHRRVVLIALHQAHGAVYIGFFPVGIACQAVIAVTFLVGFVYYIEAVVVVEGIRTRVVGVVRGAHGVEVVALKEHHILLYAFHGHCFAILWMCLVAICSLEQGEHIVDVEFVVLDFYLAETVLQ